MRAALRRASGLGLLVAGGLLTASLSLAPYSVPGAEQGVLRLAWSGRPERIEKCRRLTDAELEEVPAHMRQRVKCEGRAASYRLVLMVDGTVRYGDSLTGGGARSDRPLHVLHDVRLPPGAHSIALSVTRIDSVPSDDDSLAAARPGTAISAAREARETAERTRARREALPAVLRLETEVAVVAGEVALLTYDPDLRRLVLQRQPPR